jgi:hypothetical protein
MRIVPVEWNGPSSEVLFNRTHQSLFYVYGVSALSRSFATNSEKTSDYILPGGLDFVHYHNPQAQWANRGTGIS